MSDLLAQVFLTLTEKFDPIVTALQILEDGKLMLNVAKRRLLLKETKLQDRQKDDDNVGVKTAFTGKKSQNSEHEKNAKFHGKCFSCEKFGHRCRECRNKKAQSVQRAPGRSDKSVCFLADRAERKNSGASDHMGNKEWLFTERVKEYNLN